MELLSLVPVIGFALGWMRWQDTSAASALLHAVSAMLLILFVGSLIGLLLPAALALIIFGTASAAIETSRRVRLHKSFPVPLGVFFLLCVAYWAMQSGSSFYYYDEYSHWGVFLKEMLAHNQLWGADSNSLHPTYLPGAPLWQYYFALFSKNIEGAAYLAQFSLLLTPLIVLWDKTEWRQPAWHLGILAVVIIGLSNFGHGFTSLYVDHVLGTWFAGILIKFLVDMNSRSLRQLSSYLLPLSAFVLFKSTAAFFVLVCAGTITLLLLIHPKFASAGKSLWSRVKQVVYFPIAAIALSLLILITWNINRDALSLEETGGSTSKVASRMLSQKSVFDQDQQAELSRRFVDVILHQQISKDEVSQRYNAFSYALMPQFKKPYRLTTVTFLGLSLISLLLLWRFIVPPEGRLGWSIAAGCTWLTATAYIGVLYFGYRYVSGDLKGLELSSYVRYAHSILLPVFLFCFASLMPLFAGNQPPQMRITDNLSVGRNSVIFFLALLAVSVLERPYLRPLYTIQDAPEFRTQLDPLTERVRAKIGASRLWVFYPDNKSNGLAGQILQYQLSPGQVYVEDDPTVLLGDPVALRDELRNWEYFWYVSGSPDMDAAFERLIGEIPTERVFRIDKTSDNVSFRPVDDVFASDGI